MGLSALPNSELPIDSLQVLQEWEGYVIEIRDDEFVARLIDITAGKKYESEEAIIPMAEISEHDASHMIIGGIFRWVIGYEDSPEGRRKRVSQIAFRDMPKMTEEDFAEGRAWAEGIVSAFNTREE